MKRFSLLLIRLIGFPRYRRIPWRWRKRLGMIAGEDFTAMRASLESIRVALGRLREAQRNAVATEDD